VSLVALRHLVGQLRHGIKVRQLAAVEMRKRVSQNSGNLWTMLPQNEREEIKSKLPELILAEPK
jgi:Importin-beta N-terminal domain